MVAYFEVFVLDLKIVGENIFPWPGMHQECCEGIKRQDPLPVRLNYLARNVHNFPSSDLIEVTGKGGVSE